MNDLQRALSSALRRHLDVMPVVVVTGARQTGKSTLVRDLLADPGRTYLTLDDLDILGQAHEQPEDLVERGQRMTLDEVQRAPSVLRAVKRTVDEQRTRGRFLLTGSANLLLMKNVSETLAGRASYLTLRGMTRAEQMGLGKAGRWADLVDFPDQEWEERLQSRAFDEEDWNVLVSRGGFPTPSLHLKSKNERDIWFAGYSKTFLERDLQEISSITAIPDLRRLMRVACLRLGQLVNQTELARDAGLSQPTVHRYLNLLETSYQLVRLPAYSVNRTKRLIKSPKLYWGDTGLALHLAELDTPGGAHLENLVLLDLLVWLESNDQRAQAYYWRTTTGEEVDLVIEIDGSLIPIEIKATARPRTSDAKGLQAFRQEYPDQARTGLLIHTGHSVVRLGKGILAVPWDHII